MLSSLLMAFGVPNVWGKDIWNFFIEADVDILPSQHGHLNGTIQPVLRGCASAKCVFLQILSYEAISANGEALVCSAIEIWV